jgi:hypothetical protein
MGDTSDSPKKIGVLDFIRVDNTTIRQYHRYFHQIINSESILASEETIASARDETTKPSVINGSTNRRESGRSGGLVEIGPQCSSLGVCELFLGIDFHSIQQTKVHFY